MTVYLTQQVKVWRVIMNNPQDFYLLVQLFHLVYAVNLREYLCEYKKVSGKG